jgi:hypothetical protein
LRSVAPGSLTKDSNLRRAVTPQKRRFEPTRLFTTTSRRTSNRPWTKSLPGGNEHEHDSLTSESGFRKQIARPGKAVASDHLRSSSYRASANLVRSRHSGATAERLHPTCVATGTSNAPPKVLRLSLHSLEPTVSGRHALSLIALYSLIVPVIAFSTGSRSMLDAP